MCMPRSVCMFASCAKHLLGVGRNNIHICEPGPNFCSFVQSTNDFGYFYWETTEIVTDLG